MLGAAACGSEEEPATTEGGVELISAGTLTTCTHLPYEPFQFEDGGEIVGFDVDVVDAIAADLGVEQEVIDIPFETIQSGEALNAGQCDLAAAGMTITDVREENMDFSTPYFEATQALITPVGSGLDSADALEGRRLAVQSGTTGAVYAEEQIPGAELVTFEDLALLLTAVESGQVDAAINDNGVLLDYAADNPDLEVTTEFNTGEQYGIGVRTGNTALLEQVDATLARLDDDGSYDEIYTTWFGAAPGEAASAAPTGS
ncbi:basic amino acid ABC transporter substrate-binding protein [uncultured Pseudokineococcus sp.]|uniref:basic amino acid ABC transporter substrate-binding protein n=1 Tax=uncultured Pseudokineococcus sp. TaxID=1642928 RepID=UPI00342BBA42